MKGAKSAAKPKWRLGWSRSTLMGKYLLIILLALLFVPLIFPLSSAVYLIIEHTIYQGKSEELKYGSFNQLEKEWHQEAGQLAGSSKERIDEKLRELSVRYPEASLFWVNADGYTQLALASPSPLPDYWTHSDVIQFMKDNVNNDPFTVVAFIEQDDRQTGFMVLQLPRSLLERDYPVGVVSPFYIAFISLMFGLFMLMSLLFFRHIRKRLVRLQAAMMEHDSEGLPMPIPLQKQDEIGQLEVSFNEMVEQLRESRRSQREEEELRKRLIANLSHDLRTPLTVMNSHIYTLGKDEELSFSARESIKQLEYKMDGLGSLIENLLSYNLMASGKYTLKLEDVDVLRLVKESAAAWYPLWEREGIVAEVELSGSVIGMETGAEAGSRTELGAGAGMGTPLVWRVDKQALRRVLDNLFQNIVRHASEGGFIGIKLGTWQGSAAIIISDHGNGMDHESGAKGAGIGLAIVDYLIREMRLEWHMDSSAAGTTVYIKRQVL